MSKARLEKWQAAWPDALACWSRYTRLRDPLLCVNKVDAAKEGLTGSFAMIRLNDNSVVIDLQTVGKLGLDDYAVEVLAHEIGHHVLAPSSATDHFRLLARIRRGLPTLEQHAPLIANLYTDLLINDRLQRQENLRMDEIYSAMHAFGEKTGQPTSKLWMLYVGIYESLWKLEKGSIGGPVDDAVEEGNAWLGARLVRVYANDWMTGAGRFAALALPYLVEDANAGGLAALLGDIENAAEGCEPVGISNLDPDELGDIMHPSEDPAITGEDSGLHTIGKGDKRSDKGNAQGQMREPFEYGEILKAAGITLSDEDIAIRYYREQALPHLIRFPSAERKTSPEPQLEGLDPWDTGDALDKIDWLETVIQSPHTIPGLTTVQRHVGYEPGSDIVREPLDLDLYVDSSGSMPNPCQQVSYLTLAGAIVALSALKAGAKVQATLWASKGQVMSTDGFVTNSDEVLRVLTGFYGGGTTFPIWKMRDTFLDRSEDDPPAHIFHISDDGLDSMYAHDEHGNSGWDIAEMALRKARGGGTMALNLWRGLEERDADDWLVQAHQVQGWDVHAVRDFADLVAFSRAFSQRKYGGAAS